MLLLGQSPVFLAGLTLDTLVSFHWLRAPQRIKFKLAVIDYRALHGSAPRYLSDTFSRVADISSQSRLRSSTSSQLMVARHVLSLSESGRSPQPVRHSGIVSRTISRPPHHCQTFVVNVKHIFFGNHTRTLSDSFSRRGGP